MISIISIYPTWFKHSNKTPGSTYGRLVDVKNGQSHATSSFIRGPQFLQLRLIHLIGAI